jgi:hypothetical protein
MASRNRAPAPYVRQMKEKNGRVRCLLAVMAPTRFPSTEEPGTGGR